MKRKNFQHYVENRMDKDDHALVVAQARAEAQLLIVLQKAISSMIISYMQEHAVAIDALSHLLGISIVTLTKINRGHANLTLAKIVHICVVLKKDVAVLKVLEKIDFTI